MSFVNYFKKEINCKIVYYGPGLCGKTTNVQYIYQKTSTKNKSELVSFDTENERTIFFDFLPLDLGKIRGFKVRFHLYTVPGQNFYEATRKIILRGIDGIIFVADSQKERMPENLASLQDLKVNLKNMGHDFASVPIVMQWNKRDLPNVASVDELSEQLNQQSFPQVEAISSVGEGVFETLKTMSKMVLMNIRGGILQ